MEKPKFNQSQKVVVRSMNKGILPLKNQLLRISAKMAALELEKKTVEDSITSIEQNILSYTGGYTAEDVLGTPKTADSTEPSFEETEARLVEEDVIIAEASNDLPFQY